MWPAGQGQSASGTFFPFLTLGTTKKLDNSDVFFNRGEKDVGEPMRVNAMHSEPQVFKSVKF